MLLVTNNEKVREKFGSLCTLQYVEGGHVDVLIHVRDLVHQGHKLLTHPLAGSVKPNETPFRSVALDGASGALDLESLELIEAALNVCRGVPAPLPPGRGCPCRHAGRLCRDRFSADRRGHRPTTIIKESETYAAGIRRNSHQRH